MERAYIKVSGFVQGVNFRYETKRRAEQSGLYGWVRNTEDNKLEVMVEGEKENIEKLIKWMDKGPMLAQVENVEVSWEEYKEEFKSFEIRY